jgi:excisionase family DNA binding protein
LSERSLISISQASRMLGVSEATLRQWTDEGKIRAFITPGGHRRYNKTELQCFTGKHQRVHGLKDLVAKIEDTPPQHRELAHTYFSTASWYNKLDTESRRHLAESGRELLHLVIRYVTSEPAKKKEVEALARSIGSDFGEQVAKLGLSLTEALETFMLHRNPVINAVTDLMRRRETLNERAVEAIPLMTHIMDETLIALVAAYQQYRNS